MRLNHAAECGLSVFVLFVDLVKAFDKAVREVVLGFTPKAACDPVAYFTRIGVSSCAATWLTKYVLTNDCLLKQWGVKTKVVRILQRLHQKAWFRVDGCDSVIQSFTGGRQGCKFGSVIFNVYYTLA